MSAATHPKTPERLDKGEAQIRGLVPIGHVWDEDLQQPIPLAESVQLAQLGKAIDLERNLAAWQAMRTTLVRFIEKHLVQAKYDPKGYPLSGQLHDYYKLPSFDKRTLTKQGAEKIAQLFRFARARTETVERIASKEQALAVVRVTLLDHYRREVGSGEAACSTAEASFRGDRNEKKYGGDYRAAMNDVIARAGKRAFVQAVIYAIAGDELFEAHEGRDDDDTKKQASERPRFPKGFGSVGGQFIDEVKSEKLADVANWCRGRGKTKPKNPEAVRPVLEAIEAELDHRRFTAEDDAGEQDEFGF